MSTGSERLRRAGELFDELVDLPADARAERLEALRALEPALAVEVASLLAADAAAAGFLSASVEAVAPGLVAAASEELAAPELDGPTCSMDTAGDWSSPERESAQSGDRIGAWRLLRPLGAGGMGEVWEVERADGAFELRAALKLLKRGLDSEDLLRRFRSERQILASLRHPAIAHIYDGGLASDGRPYYVMELVPGRPLGEGLAALGLSLDAQLRVFLTICDAVDTAHRALVVHRDLKPTNVLVSDAGEPKLLDFGIAKLLEGEGSGETRAWERLMTPAYAAPEQILGEPITTATDVYALGVMLFEVLTGHLPHRRDNRSPVGLAESVRHETPERPSTVVARDRERHASDPRPSRPSTTAGADLSRQAQRIRGDLDSIVLRALAREPGRRYASAAALGADLASFLEGRPVAARPDTIGYRTTMFVRRHRLAVGAATLVVLSLIGGLVAALVSANRAERAALQAGEVQKFLVGLFEAADPDQSLGAEVTARQLLDAGVRQLEADLASEPEVQAELFDTVARIERRIGRYDSAERLARAAIERREEVFGPAAIEVADARLTLAETLFSRGEVESAASEFRAALGVLEAELDEDAAELARPREGLAGAEMYLGNIDSALALAQQVLASARRRYGEEHPETAMARHVLAQLYDAADRFPEALSELEQSVGVLDRTLGPDHPKSGEARLALAEAVGYHGDRPRAHHLFDQVTASFRRSFGDQHVLVAQSLVKHALVWINDSRPAEADAALMEALAIFTALGHFEAASCERLLGHSLLAQGRPDEAATRFARAHQLFLERFGERHAYTLNALGNLGLARVRQGDPEAALDPLLRAIEGLEKTEGPACDELRQPLLSLGEAERMRGRIEAALEHHRRVLAIAEAGVGADHAGAANARREIALDLAAYGTATTRAEAVRELELAVAIRRRSDPGSARLADWLLELAELTELSGDTARTANARAEALAIQEQVLGADDPRTVETRRRADSTR